MKLNLKYRGVADDGSTLYGQLISIDGHLCILPQGGNTAHEVNPETVSMLIGHDATGTEIYIGDSIRLASGQTIKISAIAAVALSPDGSPTIVKSSDFASSRCISSIPNLDLN